MNYLPEEEPIDIAWHPQQPAWESHSRRMGCTMPPHGKTSDLGGKLGVFPTELHDQDTCLLLDSLPERVGKEPKASLSSELSNTAQNSGQYHWEPFPATKLS